MSIDKHDYSGSEYKDIVEAIYSLRDSVVDLKFILEMSEYQKEKQESNRLSEDRRLFRERWNNHKYQSIKEGKGGI